MNQKSLPSLALLVVGSVLLLSLVGRVPSAAEGGPAVLWYFAVVAFHVGGGLIALGVGTVGLLRDHVGVPAAVLAGYLAVGMVVLVIRLEFLPGLSVPVFTVLAAGFVIGSALGAHRLTEARTERSV